MELNRCIKCGKSGGWLYANKTGEPTAYKVHCIECRDDNATGGHKHLNDACEEWNELNPLKLTQEGEVVLNRVRWVINNEWQPNIKVAEIKEVVNKYYNGCMEPCPFCGSTHIEIINVGGNGDHEYVGKCYTCGMQTKYELTKDEAIAKWNRRVK